MTVEKIIAIKAAPILVPTLANAALIATGKDVK